MTCNVGIADKILRIVVGIVIGLYGLVTAPQAGSFLLAIVGLVLILTALISFCPLYTLFGLNTGCKAS